MRIILTGPTAVGKTEISILLARKLGIPIISADSRQCYRFMDIGTGKVAESYLREIKHYNISNLTPDMDDNASAFLKRCQQWEKELSGQHKHILYVGGSTLYVQSLLRPFDDMPVSSDENLKILKKRDQESGLAELYNELKSVDPDYAEKMDGMNRQRIYRALDVYMQTGRPFSSFHHRDEPVSPPDDTIVFVFDRERSELHQRINSRVDEMIKSGFVEEVKQILQMGYKPELNALQTVGYREIISYLQENIALDEAVSLIKRNTRRYARRQLTWFRRWKDVIWLTLGQSDSKETVGKILFHMNKVAAKENMR